MSDEEQRDPKLIIDEDWKSQVQREKAQAAAQAASKEKQTGDDAEASKATPDAVAEQGDAAAKGDAIARGDEAGGRGSIEDLPPASFDFLITMLATQAMVALGHLPDASGKPGPKEKPLAKHYIDLIGVLEEKTKGNLDASERKMISEVLHSLWMAFVQS